MSGHQFGTTGIGQRLCGAELEAVHQLLGGIQDRIVDRAGGQHGIDTGIAGWVPVHGKFTRLDIGILQVVYEGVGRLQMRGIRRNGVKVRPQLTAV